MFINLLSFIIQDVRTIIKICIQDVQTIIRILIQYVHTIIKNFKQDVHEIVQMLIQDVDTIIKMFIQDVDTIKVFHKRCSYTKKISYKMLINNKDVHTLTQSGRRQCQSPRSGQHFRARPGHMWHRRHAWLQPRPLRQCVHSQTSAEPT